MAKLFLGDTEIAPIVEVPTPETKYGATINSVLGNVNADGAYQFPTESFTLDLSAVKSVPVYGLAYKFYKNTGLTGALVIGLEGNLSIYAMDHCFEGCTGITSVDLSSLTSVSATGVMNSCFRDCTGITSVDLSSLTSVSGYSGLYQCFRGCTGITSVDLSSLTSVNSGALGSCFQNCTGLTTISFPSLKEILPATTQSQFIDMFAGCIALTEIHFPSNMQSRIEQLTGYSSKFGATNATIYFDLPSTDA